MNDRLVHLLAGGISGASSCVLLQPLDLIKTRMQQSPVRMPILKLTQDIVAQESIWGLWKGTWPTVLRNIPGASLYFMLLNETRKTLRSLQFTPDAVNLLGGLTARTLAGYVVMPLTVIKVRFESDLYAYKSLSHAIRDIMAKQGPQGFFVGSVATALGSAPYAGLYVLLYENYKSLFQQVSSTPMVTNTAAGLVGGLSATLLTHPFDVIRTRKQVATSNASLFSSMVSLATNEGLKGLFSGMGPRIVRKSLASALQWAIYEELVSLYSTSPLSSSPSS